MRLLATLGLLRLVRTIVSPVFTISARVPVLFMASLALLFAAGCASDGSSDSEEPEEKPEITYSGLAGQKVAILVWADSRTRSEFNQVQVDLGRILLAKLTPKPSSDTKEQKPDPSAAQFIDPRSVVRYQREHPEIDGMPIVDIAPRLGVPRVLYVEIEELQTQSPRSILLLKGLAKATLRVAEVSEGQARVVFEERGITASYPPNAPAGVVPNDQINERTIYENTLTALASKLAARLKVK